MRQPFVGSSAIVNRAPPFLVGLLGMFALAHLAMMFLMDDVNTSFLLGDRAVSRLEKMLTALRTQDASNMLEILIALGSPGDYILFIPAYVLGGPHCIIIQAILLYMLGLYFLFELTQRFFSVRAAQITTILYCLFPATIFHPHVFVTEAICNPLLIIATFFIARYVSDDSPKAKHLIAATALIAVLAFIRHVYIFLPIACAALVFLVDWRRHAGQRRWMPAGIALLCGYCVVAAWLGIAASTPIRYQAVESHGGLGRNLYSRVERMAALGNFDMPQSVARTNSELPGAEQTLPLEKYLSILVAHPVAFLRTVASDVTNIVLNPGIPMVAGRFLGLFDLRERSSEDLKRWRIIRDQEGLLSVATELWRTTPAGFILITAGAIVWFGILALAATGFVSFVLARSYPLALRLLFPGLVLYIISVSSFAAAYTRWDHRSPIEFLIAVACVLAVMGAPKVPSIAQVTRQVMSRWRANAKS